jgi:predicted O-methyltransferase YrrM
LKSLSFQGLNFLLQEGKYNHYDCIYIDGSHETPDVLADAVLAFRLLRVGGLMIFDDFLWGLGPEAEPLMNPKLAIDSFINCYQRKIQPHIGFPVYQLYCRKLSD